MANAALGLDAADGTGGFYITELFWLPVHALVLAGLVGLDGLGFTGGSKRGKAGLRLAIVGRMLFLAAEGVAISVGTDDVPLFPLAAVTTGLGMLAAGAAVIGAGRLTGWRRYLPIAVGAYPFIFMFPILAATGERPDLSITGWRVTFIGVASRSGQQRPGGPDAPPETCCPSRDTGSREAIEARWAVRRQWPQWCRRVLAVLSFLGR